VHDGGETSRGRFKAVAVHMQAGEQIGPYRIGQKVGEGGMGEVYRATDTNLGRLVAIKVLPEAVATNPERLARFDREAKTLATLNHPNIAQIYGVERSNGATALVMELVDGPTLGDRIAHGRLPVDEALAIARQIAEALEAAHAAGVIHRDLKPANVKVRDDGTVKVLDFGLAKAIEPLTDAADLSRSPTITTPAMTIAGVLVGTPAYMSPEQARGRAIDKRADIWAFGCVLFEMLTGRRAFPDGESVSDVLAAVLRAEPEWSALPAGTPPAIRALLERCLRKDARRRLQDIGEARIQIDEMHSSPVPAMPAASPTSKRSRSVLWPAVAALAVLAAVAIAGILASGSGRDTQVVRFDVTAPGAANVLAVGEPVSPDGRLVVFVATYQGQPHLWVRPLDALEAQPLRGTEGGARPFWSPDSQYVAFFAAGKLRKVAIVGGPPSDICTCQGREGVWGPENIILIGGAGKAVMRVPATGGEPMPVTKLGDKETTHDYPKFLPDGSHFFYLARHGGAPDDWDVFIGSLDSMDRKLVPGIHASVQYSATGHLLYERDRALMIQPFDLDRQELTGEALPTVVDGVWQGPHGSFSLATNGTLAYLNPRRLEPSRLVWLDRTGKQTSVAAPVDIYDGLAVSLDGKSAAFSRPVGQAHDIFVLNLDSGLQNRITTDPAVDFSAVWSPNGRTLGFSSSRDPAGRTAPINRNGGQLYTRELGSAGQDRVLLKTDVGKTMTDWSRDERFIAYTSSGDVWVLPIDAAGAEPIRVTNTTFVENGARFSPDGHWIAYRSNESGPRPEIFVESFPKPGVKRQVSVNGGVLPRWRSDGRELFYVGPGSAVMAVDIGPDPAQLTTGPPVQLFSSAALAGAFERENGFDVSRDRFLVTAPDGNQRQLPVTVVLNWASTLAK
jgi:Tol biopolymer transport system component